MITRFLPMRSAGRGPLAAWLALLAVCGCQAHAPASGESHAAAATASASLSHPPAGALPDSVTAFSAAARSLSTASLDAEQGLQVDVLYGLAAGLRRASSGRIVLRWKADSIDFETRSLAKAAPGSAWRSSSSRAALAATLDALDELAPADHRSPALADSLRHARAAVASISVWRTYSAERPQVDAAFGRVADVVDAIAQERAPRTAARR